MISTPKPKILVCSTLVPGELSGVVLSVAALLRPLQWQSLMLPVLPLTLLPLNPKP
jgi:hypothetical protein